MPQLLAAGLRAWIIEQGPAASMYSLDPPPAGKPALHARLRQALDIADRETHWSFRAIASPHSVAALQRIRAAATVSGLFDPAGRRRLFILRNVPWSTGPKMQEAIRAFIEGGPGLPAWIRARRPTQDVTILQRALTHEQSIP